MRITALKTWLSSRGPFRREVTTIVLHATDGASVESSISWLRQIFLSYHYLIGPKGEIVKAVPAANQAKHAGESFGPSGKGLNGYSIGVCFDNFESRGELLTVQQVQACLELCVELKKNIPTIRFITTHWAVATPKGRKRDPSMLRPEDYEAIAKAAGLSIWGGTKR